MKLPIGEFLAQIRKEKGYTQREVAEKLGISNRTLSAWEQGRAYPDILTLAQLAEIYGVTADEILKGERAEQAQPTQPVFAEEADGVQPDLSADNMGSTAEAIADDGNENNAFTAKDCREAADKFFIRSKILTGVHCCGALLCCFGFVSCFFIIWLGILLLTLGACAVIVSCCLLAAFSDGALKAIGVRPYSSESLYTADQNRYALSIGKSNAVVAYICGAVWCVFALVLSLVSHGVMSLIISLSPLCFGLIMIIGAAVGSSSDIKKYGTESQRSVHSSNCKLLVRSLGFTAIPVVLAVGVIIFFAVWRETERFVDFKGQRDGMVAYMHTAVITDGDWEGEYALDLSKVTTVGEYVRVHKYFFAVLCEGGEIELFTAEIDQSTSPEVEAIKTQNFYTVYPIEVKDSRTKVYNVRYGCKAVEYTNVERSVEIKEQDGEYTVVRTEITDYSSDGAAIGVWICVLSFAVCAVVYVLKRKRIENKE